MAAAVRIAVVVPVLNEAQRLSVTLAPVLESGCECVVVDGGSSDDSMAIAQSLGARVLSAPRGRASQMNAGASIANEAQVLVFLHADVRLPADWKHAVRRSVERGGKWGRFDVELDSPARLLKLVGFMMNLRSRWTGIATGDQVMFLSRAAWEAVSGFPPIPLMEDIQISAALMETVGRPVCLRERVKVSARRWTHRGIVRTILVMWGLRSLYALGVSPARLHRLYYGRDHA